MIRRSVKTCCALIASTTLLGGCSPNGNDPSAQPGEGEIISQVDTLADGVVRIDNRVGLNGIAVVGEAVEDLRIGGERGSPEHFAYIRHLDVLNGRIYVLDGQVSEIRVFGEDGRSSHSIELPPRPDPSSRIRSFAVSPEGSLVIRDGSKRSMIREDGEVLANHPASFSPPFFPYQPQWGQDNRLVEWTFTQGPVADDRRLYREQPIRMSHDFMEQDSLPPLDLMVDLVPSTPIPRPANNRIFYYVDHEEAIWFGNSADYRIIRRTLHGDTTLVFTLNSVPARITEEEKERYTETWSASYPVAVQDVPDVKPVLARIGGDTGGRIFVFPELQDVERGTAVDVFDEGVYLGRVLLPVRLETLHHRPIFEGRFIYGVTVDENADHYGIRLQIPEGIF